MWPTSEEHLFAKFQRRRDAAALAKVFDKTAPALMRIALHLCRDAHRAEDLVQETFLAAIENADRWDRERGLFPWLVGILGNRARLQRRAAQRAPRADRLTEREVQPPDGAAADRELQSAVAAAIAELGEAYRPVLHLHLFHGLNAKQIAAAIGRPAGTVRTQLVRGLERLRRALPVGLGIACVGAALTGPALAAVRVRLLAALGPRLTASGATLSTTAIGVGGSIMKKWLVVVPLLVLGALALWQAAGQPGGSVPPPPSPGLQAATAELGSGAPDAIRAPADHAAVARTEVRDVGEVARTGGTVEVRCFARVGRANGQQAADQLPMLGAWVRLRSVEEALRDHRFGGRVDADGLVRFQGVPAARWRVLAETSWLEAEAEIEVEAGATRRVDLAIEDAQAVAVEVVDEQRRPVAQAEIWVSMFFFGRVWPMEVTTRLAGYTDANGRATVAAGRESLVGARKQGYAASPAAKSDDADGAPLLLTLADDPGQLVGVVVDDAGTPVADATVYVSPGRPADDTASERTADGRSAAPPPSVWQATGADGGFDLPGMRPGHYHVIAIADGVLDNQVEVDVRAFERTPLRIEVRRSVLLRGRTLRPDGAPIAGLLVFGYDPQGNHVAGGNMTNGLGRFTFPVPLAGYRLEIKRGEKLVQEVRSEAPLTAAVELDITIDEHLLVAGRLVDAAGAPVAGWRVIALPDDDATDQSLMRAMAFGRSQRTADDGSFELWGVEDKPLTFAALADTGIISGELLRRQHIVVGTEGFELIVPDAMLPRSLVRGRVVDAVGRPLPTAAVTSLRDGEPVCELHDGRFEIGGLRHGRHSYHVQAPGFGSRRLAVDVDRRTTDVGDFVLQPAVELRVRPVYPDDAAWLGPPPRPAFERPDGTNVWPHPKLEVVEGELVVSDLPPGNYVLVPRHDEQVAASPIPFELVAGLPSSLDWPVRVGRRRTLRFEPPANAAPAPATTLSITVRDDQGTVVFATQSKLRQAKWQAAQTFVPGSYRVTATSSAGLRFEGTFEVSLDQATATIDVPVAR